MHRIATLAALSCGTVVGVLCAGPLSTLHALSIHYLLPTRFALYGDLMNIDTAMRTIAISTPNPFPGESGQRHIRINYDSSTHFFTDGSVDDGPTGSPAGMQPVALDRVNAYAQKHHVRVTMKPTDGGGLIASGIIFVD